MERELKGAKHFNGASVRSGSPWRQPLKLPAAQYGINDAKSLACFVDKIYNDGMSMSDLYEPPASYEYQWNGK